MFWNTISGECYIKTCHRVVHVSSTEDYGLLVTESPIERNQVHTVIYIINTVIL